MPRTSIIGVASLKGVCGARCYAAKMYTRCCGLIEGGRLGRRRRYSTVTRGRIEGPRIESNRRSDGLVVGRCGLIQEELLEGLERPLLHVVGGSGLVEGGRRCRLMRSRACRTRSCDLIEGRATPSTTIPATMLYAATSLK